MSHHGKAILAPFSTPPLSINRPSSHSQATPEPNGKKSKRENNLFYQQMSLPFKSCFLILLILLHACLGDSKSIDTGKSLRSAKGEGNVAVKVRKLIGLEALLDYEPPGANPAHDPRRGGGKGR